MICFYHADADGRCAGAILHKYIQELFPNTDERYIEIQYGREESTLSNIVILPGESIYVVDFHFSPEIIERLWKVTQNIYVFDHHKTAKEVIAKYPKEVICVCDPRSNYAGCELVWNDLFPNEDMPRAVELIADRDKWAWKYGTETAQFNEGLKLYPHHPMDKIWEDLLSEFITTTAEIRRDGQVCLRYRDMLCKEFRDQWGFEVEWRGYKCYAMNLRLLGTGTEMFAEKLNEYDICIGFVYNGDGWKVSLRSDGKVDVSEIAKKYEGGGGHKEAAGFQCSTLVNEDGKLKCL